MLDGLKASLTLKPVYAMKLAKALKEAANTAQVRRAVLPPFAPGHALVESLPVTLVHMHVRAVLVHVLT